MRIPAQRREDAKEKKMDELKQLEFWGVRRRRGRHPVVGLRGNPATIQKWSLTQSILSHRFLIL